MVSAANRQSYTITAIIAVKYMRSLEDFTVGEMKKNWNVCHSACKVQICSLQEYFMNGKTEGFAFSFLGHIYSEAAVKNKPFSLSKNWFTSLKAQPPFCCQLKQLPLYPPLKSLKTCQADGEVFFPGIPESHRVLRVSTTEPCCTTHSTPRKQSIIVLI